MKKGLLGLLLVAISALTLGVNAFGNGDATGTLVIHFQALDGEYDNLGFHNWSGLQTRVRDGVDSFGAYWIHENVPVGQRIPFIAVDFANGAADWDAATTRGKLTDDVFIPDTAVVAGKTVHVYIFEGKFGNDNAEVFVADPDAYNMLLVYYDPTGNYEDELGVHAFDGWTSITEPGWASPAKVFLDAGKASDGSIIKASMLSASSANAGLLVYAGSDATKKTGDVRLSSALSATPALGDVGVAYVLSKGDAYTVNDNVWFNDNTSFIEQGFSFRLVDFVADDMTGTYAVNPTTIIVKTSKLLANPYVEAENEDEQLAAIATVKSWFAVENSDDEFLMIDRVDFARNNNTIDSFVIILDEDNALDNTDDYTIHFDSQPVKPEKTIEVTLKLTLDEALPVDTVLSVGGSFQGWTPDNPAYAATKLTDTTYELKFNVAVTSEYTTFEYKWTQGSWAVAENLTAGNRPLVVPYNVSTLVVEDSVTAWDKDADAADTKYAPPVRVAPEVVRLQASLELDQDKTAPVLTFISPLSFLGAAPENRVIIVPWGQKFNQSLFPRFAVADDRDGDITSFTFVPKGAFSVLDTRTEGDYTIMLQVEDRWGNVTQETFIFRVVKA